LARERDAASELSIVSGVLRQAQRAYESELEAAKAKAVELQWIKCETLVEKRLELGKEISLTISRLVESVGKLSQMGIELYNTLPVSPGVLTPSEPLSPTYVEQAVQVELARLGWLWAKPGILMLDYDKVPTFTKQTNDGNWWAFSKRSSGKTQAAKNV
jgi:hypothetical protein